LQVPHLEASIQASVETRVLALLVAGVHAIIEANVLALSKPGVDAVTQAGLLALLQASKVQGSSVSTGGPYSTAKGRASMSLSSDICAERRSRLVSYVCHFNSVEIHPLVYCTEAERREFALPFLSWELVVYLEASIEALLKTSTLAVVEATAHTILEPSVDTLHIPGVMALGKARVQTLIKGLQVESHTWQ
jgi:hypothetical protein